MVILAEHSQGTLHRKLQMNSLIPNMKKIFRSHVIGVLVSAVLLSVTTAATAGIKCWTNKDGVRECGNAVPPEYAQQEHQEKSASGMTIKTQERAKTPEEIAVEREARAAAALKQAEIDGAVRKQAAADKVLLDTFSSEDDLVLARDGQIANLDSQIKLTESHIAKLTKSRDELISKAAIHEQRKQEVPEALTGDIANLRQQIADHEAFIQSKHDEQGAIRTKFDMDIARFRELRSVQRSPLSAE